MRSSHAPRFLPRLAGLSLVLGLGACSWSGLVGSGVPASEVRAVGGFERVHLRGAGDLVATIGEAHSLEITCDDNLLPYVVAEVDEGTLEIGLERGSYRFAHGLKLRLTAPRLDGVSVSGSGDVRVSGVHGERFDVSISGSGSVRAQGHVEHVEARVSGSGDVHLFDLHAEDVEVSISGSGSVDVHAERDLDARVSGSGDVRYEGSPQVAASVSGSGTVTSR